MRNLFRSIYRIFGRTVLHHPFCDAVRQAFHYNGGWVNDQIKAAQEYQGAWYSTHEFETAPKIMQDIHEIHGKEIVGFFLSFPEESGESTVKVRTGVSLVDIAGARNNLQKDW